MTFNFRLGPNGVKCRICGKDCGVGEPVVVLPVYSYNDKKEYGLHYYELEHCDHHPDNHLIGLVKWE